jgi:hypothetical protein
VTAPSVSADVSRLVVGESVDPWVAGSESNAWVAATTRSAAPESKRAYPDPAHPLALAVLDPVIGDIAEAHRRRRRR